MVRMSGKVSEFIIYKCVGAMITPLYQVLLLACYHLLLKYLFQVRDIRGRTKYHGQQQQQQQQQHMKELQQHLHFSQPASRANKPIELLQMEYAHSGPGGVILYKPKQPDTPTKTFNNQPANNGNKFDKQPGNVEKICCDDEVQYAEPIRCRIEYR